jgi:putative PIN family toxin of toxin-antitoxin system
MRVVVDTNVFVSYLLSPRGSTVWLLSLWRDGRFDIVISPALFTELVGVLQRSHISERVDVQRRFSLLRRLRQEAVWTPGVFDASGATPDPKDDMLISIALETGAQYVVTWDAALLSLLTPYDLRLLTPEEFIALISQS